MPNISFFRAIGGLALLFLFSCSNPSGTAEQAAHPSMASFDWQGHRGARGLVPENSIPSFLKALEFPAITTLELDIVISKDRQIVLSHEPWMSASICSHPDGRPVTEEEEEELVIYKMTYEEVMAYDCGSRGNERFPEQVAQAVYKPTLRAVVKAVKKYSEQNQKSLPDFNIEIKSRPAYDGEKMPIPMESSMLLLEEIKALGIQEQCIIQSFDKRVLQAVHQIDTSITTALLIENTLGVEKNIMELGFVPDIYSPYYKLLTANVVHTIHSKGMKVIPWTVNDSETMTMLMGLGVDGIITDFPDRIP